MRWKLGMVLLCAGALALLSGCPCPTCPKPSTTPTRTAECDKCPEQPTRASIVLQRVPSRAAVAALPQLSAGEYRVHLIDVGTGLAVLVEGADFRLLYDGGSGDDKRGLSATAGNRSRLVAYLWAAFGPSGDAGCVPVGDSWNTAPTQHLPIDHVVLSHPHEDHGVLLDDVLTCYEVANIWDSGAVNDAAFYETFVRAVADERGRIVHVGSHDGCAHILDRRDEPKARSYRIRPGAYRRRRSCRLPDMRP